METAREFIGPIQISAPDPLPEPVQVGDSKPIVRTTGSGSSLLIGSSRDSYLHVIHSDKRRCIEAFNAAAKVLSEAK